MFSDTLRKHLPLYNRISYVPKPGYNKAPPVSSVPMVDNLYLPIKCGFTLPFDPDVSMEAYLCAIGDIVGDHNMIFAGKNNGVVKIYLSSEVEVTKLFDSNPQIFINDKPFLLRKLFNHGQRIFLCNVEPEIPDNILIEELSKHAKVVSPMKFVNLGVRNGRFSHLIGYRRMVSVDDVENLPPYFNITFENKHYKIFTLIDKVKCFRCHAEGHLANNCPGENKEDKNSVAKTPAQDHLQRVLENYSNVITSSPTPVCTPVPDVPSFSHVDALMPTFSSSSQTKEQPKEDFPELILLPTALTDNAGSASLPGPVICVDEEIVKEDQTEIDVVLDVKSKKRPSESLVKTGDKKVRSEQNIEFGPILPIIGKYNSSVDSTEFVRLLDGLKNSRKKVEVIKHKFNMLPADVMSLLDNLALDLSLDSKLKSKLKHLSKSILASSNNLKAGDILPVGNTLVNSD